MNRDRQDHSTMSAFWGSQVMIAALILTAPSLAVITAGVAVLIWSGATACGARALAASSGSYMLGIVAEGAGYHLAQPSMHPVYQQWVAPLLPAGPLTTTATAAGVSLPNPFMGGILFLQQFLTATQIETWTIAVAVLVLLVVLAEGGSFLGRAVLARI